MSESDDVAAFEALLAAASLPGPATLTALAEEDAAVDDGGAEREPERDTYNAPPMGVRVDLESARLPYDTEAPPFSARQPRDDARLVDDALAGLDDEDDGPPTSGEVTSQRKPSVRGDEVHSEPWDDAIATLAPPGVTAPGAFDGALLPSDTVRARGRVAWSEPPFARAVPPEVRIVSEPAPLPAPMPTGVGDAVAAERAAKPSRYEGAAREGRAPTFGELIAASLALGADLDDA